MTSFEEILNKPISEAERPRPLPTGEWLCSVVERSFGKSSKKGTDFVEFTLKPIQPGDDVDKKELKEQGGVGERTLRYTFYPKPKSDWRLRKFLEDCGYDYKPGKTTFGEGIEEIIGAQVIAIVIHEPSNSGDSIYANIRSTLPVGN